MSYPPQGNKADISGVATAAALVTVDTNVDTLIARLTAARAGYLDNIDNVTLKTLAAMRGTDGVDTAAMRGTDSAPLASDWTAALATALGNYTAARAGYLDELAAANLPADVDQLKLDTQIRPIQSGAKSIDAAATKYLHIDSGTSGAEIVAVVIEGINGHDWTLDIYVPAADAEAATQAKSKRDTIVYAAADTEGGLLGPFGILFDGYLDFTNDGANDQIDQVTILYRSRGVLTLTWET